MEQSGIPPITLLIILAITFTPILANSIRSSSSDISSNEHHRERRQHTIGEYALLKCNRAVWKSVMEPHLIAEGRSLRNVTNDELFLEYSRTLEELKKWKSANLNKFEDICGLQTYLECNDEGRCICGTGNLPYKYVTMDGNTCLAHRGSVCHNSNDCAAGLTCQERFCGGSTAFIEEIDSSDAVGTYENHPKVFLFSFVTLALSIF